MIDGSAYVPEKDDSFFFSKGKDVIVIDNPFFRKTMTYEGPWLGEYSTFTTRVEVPIISNLFRKLFGQEAGDYMGQYERSEAYDEDDLRRDIGFFVRQRHPLFVKGKFV